jgi:RNA recognition motif-containing protein
MDERSPLDNRSLSHTSREPEGQAWAQIGTKASAAGVKTAAVPAVKTSPAPTGAAATTPAAPIKSPPARGGAAEEDALSEDGHRPLQVVEDAEPEPPPNDETVAASSNSAEEEKKGNGEDGPSDATGGDATDKSEGGGEKEKGGVRDRTNSNDPKMIRSRVFVGHLNTDKCSRLELEELFSPFGKVASCSLQHGYGFVQYFDEQAAKRAITELHGLQFKGMKLVVDKTAAYKKMLGENPKAPKPWTDRDDQMYDVELRRREAAIYEREYAMYERSARLEELERMYYDRYPPSMHHVRDPYYERYYDRALSSRDPYMERYRHYPEVERGRYYDRSAVGLSASSSFERAYYDRERSSYDRPRDDPYDRREKDAFRDHSLRDREPFERFDSSRRL